MACYQCGSEGGGEFQLCPECIKKKRDEIEALREKIKAPSGEDSISHVVVFDPRYKIMLFILTWAICAVGATLSWDLIFRGYPIKSSAVAVLSLIVTLTLVHGLTGLYFWIKMATLDLSWFILCVLLPIAAYSYAFRYWQENRIIFAVNIFSFLFAVLLILYAWPLVSPFSP